MGVGYQASALHLIRFLDTNRFDPDPGEPPSWLARLPDVNWCGTAKFCAIPASEIVAWRDALAEKYQGKLGENLTWDETGEYAASADIAVTGDSSLRYIAARIDENGPEALDSLVDAPRPAIGEITRALEAANRRGLSIRFPQLI